MCPSSPIATTRGAGSSSSAKLAKSRAVPQVPAEAASTQRWRAMQIEGAGRPLQRVLRDRLPVPAEGQLCIKVGACGVCRTDLHLVDGELPLPNHPVVPGHEIVGRVSAMGEGVTDFAVGDRVGVPWLAWSCGRCAQCRGGRENLCPHARFTGWQVDGGYAEYAVADARYVFRIPDRYSDEEAAPLLCAGLIGWRAYNLTGRARRLGLYGFGAAAHLIAQVARFQGREVYAFTRIGDEPAQTLARELGALWAGSSDHAPPAVLDAALIFAPVGDLVPTALSAVRPGGTVVCASIHMSDIPSFPYELLWGERVVRSVANLTRHDGEEFLALAPRIPVRTTVTTFPLVEANEALDRLRTGRLAGAAVLVV